MKNPQPHWLSLDKKSLRAWQMLKLRRYLSSTVLPFSPHYGALFKESNIRAGDLRDFQCMEQIPFSSKEDLLKDARQFVLAPAESVLKRRPANILAALVRGRETVKEELEREFRPLMLTSTTGRSAEPAPFLYTAHDIKVLSMAGARVMRICAARRDMRMLNLFPFAPHLAFWQTHYAGMEYGVFMVSTGGGKALGTEGNLRLMRKIDPDVLIGMPTFLYHLLRAAVDEGVRCAKLSKIVLGGEKAPSGMRRRLRALAAELGASPVDVLPIYGFTEAKMAWPQCPGTDTGYHLSPDLGIMEIIDPVTGAQMPEGEAGEVVWTPLEARGSVVLRYRTGDIASGGIVHGKCPHCGRNMPRIMGDISRTSEIREMRLDKLKGTLIDFNQLEHVLDNCEEVATWQVEIRKTHDDPLELDELILHVNKAGGCSEEDAREALYERFVAETETHPNAIVFHTAEEMRRLHGVGIALKEQRVVDHRPKAVAPGESTQLTHA
ncbi:MAG TPA: AMP-binding protein [Chthoniobacteraceae bacterium]|jgi:phenylacetate-coenzyme A ligase PaaK-like adenylate-forming protein|nr:AMP-binding protein [Chthoniobacteraceae bacterium]